MNRLASFFGKTIENLKVTAVRFPVVLLLLAGITITVSMLIENNFSENEEFLTRLIFAGIFGVFFGTAAQFTAERLEPLKRFQWLLRTVTFGAAVLYFFLMTSPAQNDGAIAIRLFVTCFALFALYLYVPSTKDAADFVSIALTNFKSAFVALLYGVILFLGLLAIYYAVDLLLIDLNSNLPSHLAAIVFIFFTPVYFLSLLPYFNSTEKAEQEKRDAAAAYPRFLAILISYIAIPLVFTFSAVLAAYFIKILITMNWPVGQIGPMVLVYSAVGLLLYILSGHLTDRFALLYRKLFPILLIPFVALQLTSVYIRLNAYGVTESRYYVALFGIFSIVCSLYLIFSKFKKQRMIALLAACFAIFSILPIFGAFHISRASQTARVEQILEKNGMLQDDQLTPKTDIPDEDKQEITSIINYMQGMGHLNGLSWLPEEYKKDSRTYIDFEKVFGFSPYYESTPSGEYPTFINLGLNYNTPIDITGFESFSRISFYSEAPKDNNTATFLIAGKEYVIKQMPTDNEKLLFSVFDPAGNVVLDISLDDFLKQVAKKGGDPKSQVPPEDVTFDISNNTIRLRLILENINLQLTKDGEITQVDGSALLLAAKP